MKRLFCTLSLLCLLLLTPGSKASAGLPLFSCRMGVGASNGSPRLVDLFPLQAEGLINWTYNSELTLPPGMAYIRMLRTGDYQDRYQKMRAAFEAYARAHPGQDWIIGNEPDTRFEDQDALPPETYAERFYEFASRLRKADPRARIGFGTITQPTPLRLRYLQRAWQRLGVLAGGRAGASALVDFWAVHAFILNEAPGEWGVGVPPGFDNDYADAVRITNLADTHSLALFQQRVRAFRKPSSSVRARTRTPWRA